MLRQSPKEISLDPEWIARIRAQLRKSLSPVAIERAEKIIGHPAAVFGIARHKAIGGVSWMDGPGR